jgi:hypothetical protein
MISVTESIYLTYQILWFCSTGIIQVDVVNDIFLKEPSVLRATDITKNKTLKEKINFSWLKEKYFPYMNIHCLMVLERLTIITQRR